MNTTRNALRHYCWNTSPKSIMSMCIKRDWYNAGSSVAYEHMLDFVRNNETIEDEEVSWRNRGENMETLWRIHNCGEIVEKS